MYVELVHNHDLFRLYQNITSFMLLSLKFMSELVASASCPSGIFVFPEGGPAVYTLIQCTPLLVEKAGVAPDVTLRFTAHKQVRVQAREPPWL